MKIHLFQNQRGNIVNVLVDVEKIEDYSITFTMRGAKFTIQSPYRIEDFLFQNAGLSVLAMYISGSTLYPLPVVASVKPPNFELKTELLGVAKTAGVGSHPEVLSRMRTLELLVGEIQTKIKESDDLAKFEKYIPSADKSGKSKKDIIKV